MDKTTTALTWHIYDNTSIEVTVDTDEKVWGPTYYAQQFGDIIASQPMRGLNVLDVGTGSGILGILAAKMGANVVGTDLNPAAVEAANENAAKNGVSLTCYVSDGLKECQRRSSRFDLIVCNSPSIPGRTSTDRTTKEEWSENGPNGRALLDNVLVNGRAVLKPNGRLLTCSNSEQGWETTETALRNYWASYNVVADKVFPMDLNIYETYIRSWIEKGYVWEEAGKLFHNTKFFMAYR